LASPASTKVPKGAALVTSVELVKLPIDGFRNLAIFSTTGWDGGILNPILVGGFNPPEKF